MQKIIEFNMKMLESGVGGYMLIKVGYGSKFWWRNMGMRVGVLGGAVKTHLVDGNIHVGLERV